MSYVPSTTEKEAWRRMERRRRGLSATASSALLGFKEYLVDGMGSRRVGRLIEARVAEAEDRFAEAIAALSADVGSMPPVTGLMGRAVVTEGTALHLILDIVRGIAEGVKIDAGPVGEAAAAPLGDAFDEAARLVKSLPGVGKRGAACRDAQRGARRLIERAAAWDDLDAAFHAWRLVDRAAADVVWVAAYFLYIETGAMGEFDPRTRGGVTP